MQERLTMFLSVPYHRFIYTKWVIVKVNLATAKAHSRPLSKKSNSRTSWHGNSEHLPVLSFAHDLACLKDFYISWVILYAHYDSQECQSTFHNTDLFQNSTCVFTSMRSSASLQVDFAFLSFFLRDI